MNKFALTTVFFARFAAAQDSPKPELFQECTLSMDDCKGTSFFELNACKCFRSEFCDETCPPAM